MLNFKCKWYNIKGSLLRRQDKTSFASVKSHTKINGDVILDVNYLKKKEYIKAIFFFQSLRDFIIGNDSIIFQNILQENDS